MKNVTINSRKQEILGDTPLKLNNGSLVLHYDRTGGVKSASIVTSYRGNNAIQGSTREYCSLVNLDTGYLECEERVSRTTNIKRVLSHLYTGDFNGKEALERGEYIEVHNVGDYKIDLSISR